MSAGLKEKLSPFIDGFYNMAEILPLIIAMCVCSQFSMKACLITAVIACIAYPLFGVKPSYGGFLIAFSAAAVYGTGTAFTGMLLCSVILFAVSFLDYSKLKNALYSPAVAGLMLGFAIYMIVMQTTVYFGIGATGGTAVEMFKSYRSLGFHANWRGVLYGTIVLVLMIVYRRKFRNFSKKISAPFWCVVFSIILNLLLIPSADNTPISEISNYSLMPGLIFAESFADIDIIGVIITGASLCFCILYRFSRYENAPGKADKFGAASVMLISSVCGALPSVPCERKAKSKKDTTVIIITSVLLSTTILMLLRPFIERLPLPSASVILIIGMWQQIEWKFFKETFKSGVISISAFLIIFAVTLLLNPNIAVIISAFFCAAYKLKNRKVIKE